jgi:hypothetical protein
MLARTRRDPVTRRSPNRCVIPPPRRHAAECVLTRHSAIEPRVPAPLGYLAQAKQFLDREDRWRLVGLAGR